MDGVDRVIGGEAVGADIAVFPLQPGATWPGCAPGRCPELDILHDAAHQAQVHGEITSPLADLICCLTLTYSLTQDPLEASGKLGVQTVDPSTMTISWGPSL